MIKNPRRVDYFIGLDLGQAQDYSALAILERSTDPDQMEPPRYGVRWLERWPLGTKYGAIVDDVVKHARKPILNHPCIAVDQTGVGRAVVDMIWQAGLPAVNPILITAGHATTLGEDGAHHVPKKELVSTLQVLLQSRRLSMSRRLEYAETLGKELAAFRVKLTAAANETFESWRERDHDDLVLAVGMAVWLGERYCVDSMKVLPPMRETAEEGNPRPSAAHRRGLFGLGRNQVHHTWPFSGR